MVTPGVKVIVCTSTVMTIDALEEALSAYGGCEKRVKEMNAAHIEALKKRGTGMESSGAASGAASGSGVRQDPRANFRN
jgi:hypothetical protein